MRKRLIYETFVPMIYSVKQAEKEIRLFPDEIREDLADALARLNEGQRLSMPLSRPMPSIGKGVHELRFRDRTGVFRVIYVFVGSGDIWLLHGFAKKTQSTPKPNIDVAKKRLKEIL